MFSMMIFVFFMFLFSIIFMILGLFMYTDLFLCVFEWTIYFFGSMNFSMIVFVDYISMIFLGVVLIISSMVFLYSMEYMFGDKSLDR